LIETYGKVWLSKGVWCVECEPQVRSRLKRVFAKAPQHASHVVWISDTPENARDLEWFLERYPMDCRDQQMLTLRANQHRDTEQRLADLLSCRQPPESIELALPPREYQLIAAAQLEITKGLLLADDLGLGKTVSGICPMAKSDNLPAVVVCPAHLQTQWEKEVRRFLPALNVHVIQTSKTYSLVNINKHQGDLWPERLPDVLIISYHKLRGWGDMLAEIVRYVVFDECQQLRRSGSQIFSACRMVARKAKLRLGLSATPIYNYGSEFFNVIDTLRDGALGTREEFLREWCAPAPGGNSRLSDSEEFGNYLRREGLMLRRTRMDVGRELPPLTRIAHTIECDLNVINSMIDSAMELAKVIVAHNEKFRGEKMNAAGELDNLIRQATGISKAPYVAEFVKMLIEETDERIVLFGWHREVYRIWLDRLKAFNPVMYTGSETGSKKNESIQRFIKGESKVLIMSLRSGAGVDGLQDAAKVAVFGELDWSPGVHEQCMGRLHRDGQTDPVVAYYMIADEGADPVMADVLGVKREQLESVRNPGADIIEQINTGEDHIKRLAKSLLERSKEALVTDEP
jgi:SNF2 family DNA or RNA helicase